MQDLPHGEVRKRWHHLSLLARWDNFHTEFDSDKVTPLSYAPKYIPIIPRIASKEACKMENKRGFPERSPGFEARSAGFLGSIGSIFPRV